MADISTTTPFPASSPTEAEIVFEPDSTLVSAIGLELEEARTLLEMGKRQEALAICAELLERTDLPLRSGAKLSLLLRHLDQTEIADQMKALILAQIEGKTHRLKNPDTALLPAAEALADLEEYDLAEQLCQQAMQIAPDDISVIIGYAAFLIHRARHKEAQCLAETFCDRTDQGFNAHLHFAMIFSHLDFATGAKTFFERAKAKCRTSTQRAELDYLLAANGMSVPELDQHGMAVEMFDGFANNYDAQLVKLENNGPNMVFSALEELALSKTRRRRVLDAGCGTGLCAGFLRAYAKELVGVDLSVKMLEQSRAKRVYDTLARTDLAVGSTYPEGSFDMIVCADVLVYVGALDAVFENFRRVLTPGGWLLITCETETDAKVKTGFHLYPSGRYKHSDAYLQGVLTRAGFPKPKLLKHARLRNEMAKPILGTVMAVQKPALVIG